MIASSHAWVASHTNRVRGVFNRSGRILELYDKFSLPTVRKSKICDIQPFQGWTDLKHNMLINRGTGCNGWISSYLPFLIGNVCHGAASRVLFQAIICLPWSFAGILWRMMSPRVNGSFWIYPPLEFYRLKKTNAEERGENLTRGQPVNHAAPFSVAWICGGRLARRRWQESQIVLNSLLS